ncbi:hypothetical protein [Halomonas sp. RA08-2]|uniref:hypothetical protein n=1 Tax=Halomonas sp. RA08-2 TaxID=3440842 RepID=UPI003EEA95D1
MFVEPNQLAEGWDRDSIQQAMVERGVPCFSGSCSEVYREKAFDGTGLRPKTPLPMARELGETSLMFLVHPTLTVAEIDKTCRVLREVMAQAAERRKTLYRLLGKQTGVHPPQTGYRGIPATSDEEQE